MTRRSWQISADAPYTPQIAADGSTALIDYADDQAWELSLGGAEAPALGISTRLGGRVGLLSIQPMWWLDGHAVYLPGDYVQAPVIAAFAPGYISAEARLSPSLLVVAAWYALDSHSLALRFTLRNRGEPQTVTLDLVGFIAADRAERKPAPLALGGDAALWMGTWGDVDPVLVLKEGKPGEGGRRLTRTVVLPEGGTAEWRALVVSLPGRARSRDHAVQMMHTNWVKPPTSFGQGKSVIPLIETGDAHLDSLLAFSYQQVMAAFVRPYADPAPGLLPRRQPDAGYRPHVQQAYGERTRPVGGDEVTPPDAYLLALAAASVRPEWAQDVVRGYLAVQRADGWIDWSPGLAGERRGWLCLPILARLAWSIFQYSEDADFLTACFPGLLRFFNRWFMPDVDRDGDGLPEWAHEGQTAYPFLPIFSRGLTVGQNADLRHIESPDLIAWLLSEGISLHAIAGVIGQPVPPDLAERIARLKEALSALWLPDLGRFGYRDRDTHAIGTGRDLVIDRPANETIAGLVLDPPQRLIVEVVGGSTRANTLTLHIAGIAHDGAAVTETASADDFSWTAGRGTYTTRHAWHQVETLRSEGVIALYRVNVRTVDTTYLDISALMPLWAVDISSEHARAVHALLKDPAHFWRAHGVVMFSAQDSAYRPDKVEFSAGVWLFWQTLMGEALIEMGDYDSATDLLGRVLAGMLPVVRQQKAFFAGYHAERPAGLGARGHAAGAAPLHLFLRVIGVRIVNAERVWTGGAYSWGQPVTVMHHGVRVRRAADGTTVTFPGGETVTLPPGTPWSCVTPDGWREQG